MPFTLAHGAAALPFRHFRLVLSGVLVGAFAPDFEYFLRLKPGGGFGHRPAGIVLFSLPAALVVLWLFHAFVKLPATRLLPAALQIRLAHHRHEFRFRPAARFALIVASVLVGIATHVVWDAFTHGGTWPYRHWAILRRAVHLPVVGLYPVVRILQHGSTIVGMAALLLWLAHWYRTREPSREPLDNVIPLRRKITILVAVITTAILGAAIRAIKGTGILSHHHFAPQWFFGQFVITFMALVWWELVAYGVISSRVNLSPHRATPAQNLS